MEQVQKEKLIGAVVLVFGFLAFFVWLRYVVLLPPLPNPSPSPSQPPRADIGKEIYQGNAANPVQQIPNANPFKSKTNANPFSNTYDNPFK